MTFALAVCGINNCESALIAILPYTVITTANCRYSKMTAWYLVKWNSVNLSTKNNLHRTIMIRTDKSPSKANIEIQYLSWNECLELSQQSLVQPHFNFATYHQHNHRHANTWLHQHTSVSSYSILGDRCFNIGFYYWHKILLSHFNWSTFGAMGSILETVDMADVLRQFGRSALCSNDILQFTCHWEVMGKQETRCMYSSLKAKNTQSWGVHSLSSSQHYHTRSSCLRWSFPSYDSLRLIEFSTLRQDQPQYFSLYWLNTMQQFHHFTHTA